MTLGDNARAYVLNTPQGKMPKGRKFKKMRLGGLLTETDMRETIIKSDKEAKRQTVNRASSVLRQVTVKGLGKE